MEYRTTLLDNFNDPGYLDLGLGATWTPAKNLVVVVHPFNYNFVFSSGDTVFESSMGTKIVADYTRQIGAVSFKPICLHSKAIRAVTTPTGPGPTHSAIHYGR